MVFKWMCFSDLYKYTAMHKTQRGVEIGVFSLPVIAQLSVSQAAKEALMSCYKVQLTGKVSHPNSHF